MSGDTLAKMPKLLCTLVPPYSTVCMYNIFNTKYVEFKHFDNIFVGSESKIQLLDMLIKLF